MSRSIGEDNAVHFEGQIGVSTAQSSRAGRKDTNEDSMGLYVPESQAEATKGMAAAIADGVSAAEAGQEAAEVCVTSFLGDYYGTPDAWTVETSAQKVLTSINRWLCSRGQHMREARKGYVSTLSVLVLKSHTAHVFHVGDTRVHLLRDGELDALTRDHATPISEHQTYLTRAMGLDVKLDVDYGQWELRQGDVFLLTTDGVHDHVEPAAITSIIGDHGDDLGAACEALLDAALAAESPDNLTCQLIRVESLPDSSADEMWRKLNDLPFPPPLSKGQLLDGYRVERELHSSSRSQMYLVRDEDTGARYAMKTPSVNFDDDPAYLERFVMEHWIASRIDSAHVARAVEPLRPRTFQYNLFEYVEGESLATWIQHHAQPDVRDVAEIIGQVGKGLQAMHRRETLHQDVKPANIVVGRDGVAKLVDMGSCRVGGIAEIAVPIERDRVLGTARYSAPEYRLGYQGDARSEQFSLGCVAYEMLTGKLPYGEAIEHVTNRDEIDRLRYQPAHTHNPLVPIWVDGALRRAVDPNPRKRYAELSEFLFDLSRPNPRYVEAMQEATDSGGSTRLWRGLALALLLTQTLTLVYLLQ